MPTDRFRADRRVGHGFFAGFPKSRFFRSGVSEGANVAVQGLNVAGQCVNLRLDGSVIVRHVFGIRMVKRAAERTGFAVGERSAFDGQTFNDRQIV